MITTEGNGQVSSRESKEADTIKRICRRIAAHAMDRATGATDTVTTTTAMTIALAILMIVTPVLNILSIPATRRNATGRDTIELKFTFNNN